MFSVVADGQQAPPTSLLTASSSLDFFPMMLLGDVKVSECFFSAEVDEVLRRCFRTVVHFSFAFNKF